MRDTILKSHIIKTIESLGDNATWAKLSKLLSYDIETLKKIFNAINIDISKIKT